MNIIYLNIGMITEIGKMAFISCQRPVETGNLSAVRISENGDLSRGIDSEVCN